MQIDIVCQICFFLLGRMDLLVMNGVIFQFNFQWLIGKVDELKGSER